MRNRNKRLHYIKKHVYKERKEITHGEIGEMITTPYIYEREINTMFTITKWSQDQCTK